MSEDGSPRSGGEYVYQALVKAGIELIVGLPGTQTLPLDRIVSQKDNIRYVMSRHETAVPHVAWGYFETSGRPAATLTVPGPGETNAMHGLKNALEDSVPIVHITGDIHPAEMGKKPIHEIEPNTYDNVVKENIVISSKNDLPAAIEQGITRALTPPYGPVRLGIPSEFLADEFTAPEAQIEPEVVERDNRTLYDDAVELLTNASKPVLYVGGGVRRSDGGVKAIRSLARKLEAPVITTYKGKGVFPEDDSQFLGVSGSSLPSGAIAALEAADVVLAIGTDFDGLGTQRWSIPMGDHLIHISLDPDTIGAAYEPDLAIIDDAAQAARTLHTLLADCEKADRWDPDRICHRVRHEYESHLQSKGLLDGGEPIYSPALLRTVRNVLPDESIVTVDVGGFRLWTMQLFEVNKPQNFVAAGSWAGMGVGLPAAIGAAIANPEKPVVCLTGDGGILMCMHELATAYEEQLDLTIIISNNSDYGVISKKSQLNDQLEELSFAWESPSFTSIAEGFGWAAEEVTEIKALETAVQNALTHGFPTLIDVDVPTIEPTASEVAEFNTDCSF